MKEKSGRNVSMPQLQENVNFVIKEAKNVCKNIGERSPGSENEKKAHDYFQDIMKNYSDNVTQKEFTLSPKAFTLWTVPSFILILISILLFLLTSFDFLPDAFYLPIKIVSILFAVLSVIFMLTQFVYHKPFLDFLFKKSQSFNTIAKRVPTGETKKKIILCGNLDSPFQSRFSYKMQKNVVAVTLFFAVLCVAITVASIFINKSFLNLPFLIAQGVVLIWFFILLFMNNTKKSTLGAIDNLSGAFSAGAVIRYLSENNIRFEDTEVTAVAFGGHNSGLRGAKEFAKTYADDLKNADTIFIGLDTLSGKENLSVKTKNISDANEHDKKVFNLVMESSKNVGLEIPFSKKSFGESDVAALSKNGASVATITAINSSSNYQSNQDTPENLKRDGIESAIKICIEAVYSFAENK